MYVSNVTVNPSDRRVNQTTETSTFCWCFRSTFESGSSESLVIVLWGSSVMKSNLSWQAVYQTLRVMTLMYICVLLQLHWLVCLWEVQLPHIVSLMKFKHYVFIVYICFWSLQTWNQNCRSLLEALQDNNTQSYTISKPDAHCCLWLKKRFTERLQPKIWLYW